MPNKFSFIAFNIIARYNVFTPRHWDYYMDSNTYYTDGVNTPLDSSIYIFKNLLLFVRDAPFGSHSQKDYYFNLRYIKQ